ncbi:MAG: HAD family hydrolase, partial [Candidatus Micrarchaeia archaeon]
KDNDKLVETLVAYSRNAYREVYMPILIKPAKNAVETVKKLQEDFDVAIATNNPRDTTIKLLKILELDGIKTIVSSDDVENPKPAPDVLVKAMKELNRAPENCLYIGDSYLDVQAAKSAKIKIALVTHAYNKDLESNYRVNDLTQICSIAKN